MKITGTLTLTVIYDATGSTGIPEAAIRGYLLDVAENAAANGLLSGDSEVLAVKTWDAKVRIK